MSIILIAVTILVSFLIGFFLGKIQKRFDGSLIVDDKGEEITRWVLNMNVDSSKISNKKDIRLKVRKFQSEGVV